jgi:hypothetical protein
VSQSQGGGLFSVLQPARQSDGQGPWRGSRISAPWIKHRCPGVSIIKTLDKFHESDDTTMKLDAERIHYEMLVTSTCSSLTPTDLATETSTANDVYRSREESKSLGMMDGFCLF